MGESQMMVSVPKRIFRRAVKRNSVKRHLREAYRIERHRLSEGVSMRLAFIYTSGKDCSAMEIKESVVKILDKIKVREAKVQ